MINSLGKISYAVSMFILWLFGIVFTMAGGYSLAIRLDPTYYSYFFLTPMLYLYRFIDLPLSGLIQTLTQVAPDATMYPLISILSETGYQITLPILLFLIGSLGLLSLYFINRNIKFLYIWYANIILLFSLQLLELNVGLYSPVGSLREIAWILLLFLSVFIIRSFLKNRSNIDSPLERTIIS